jgi:hypothetical protein
VRVFFQIKATLNFYNSQKSDNGISTNTLNSKVLSQIGAIETYIAQSKCACSSFAASTRLREEFDLKFHESTRENDLSSRLTSTIRSIDMPLQSINFNTHATFSTSIYVICNSFAFRFNFLEQHTADRRHYFHNERRHSAKEESIVDGERNVRLSARNVGATRDEIEQPTLIQRAVLLRQLGGKNDVKYEEAGVVCLLALPALLPSAQSCTQCRLADTATSSTVNGKRNVTRNHKYPFHILDCERIDAILVDTLPFFGIRFAQIRPARSLECCCTSIASSGVLLNVPRVYTLVDSLAQRQRDVCQQRRI